MILSTVFPIKYVNRHFIFYLVSVCFVFVFVFLLLFWLHHLSHPIIYFHMGGLVQDCSISIANALEILQFSTESSTYILYSGCFLTWAIVRLCNFRWNIPELYGGKSMTKSLGFHHFDDILIQRARGWVNDTYSIHHWLWTSRVNSWDFHYVMLQRGVPSEAQRNENLKNLHEIFTICCVLVGFDTVIIQ